MSSLEKLIFAENAVVLSAEINGHPRYSEAYNRASDNVDGSAGIHWAVACLAIRVTELEESSVLNFANENPLWLEFCEAIATLFIDYLIEHRTVPAGRELDTLINQAKEEASKP